MAKGTSHVPQGLPELVPQIVIENAKGFMDFAVKAFGFEVGGLMPTPDGKVMHGHLKRGSVVLFVSDPIGFAKPTKANLFLYVTDVDALAKRAVAAGAKEIAAPNTMFWGDRWGMLADPFGNEWQIATHVEDVSPEEMQKRMASQGGGG
jgi:PhnB protein